MTITVNGNKRETQSPGDTPLLYVLRNELDVMSPQFGCGLAQCGACSVLLDGKEIRACITPLSSAAGKEVTTVEGLPARWAKQKNLSAAEAAKTLHPVSAPKQLELLLPKLSLPALLLADNATSHPEQIAPYLARVDQIDRVTHIVIPVGKGLSVAHVARR